MKQIFTFLAAVLLSVSVFAQSPEKMSYQAVLRDASNDLVISTEVSMQITILQGSTSGTEVYVETHMPTTNSNGLVSIEIGAGTVKSGDFTTIDWPSDMFFIKTETDLDGEENYTITGTSQLLSVPYALHAKTAESVTGEITENDPVFTEWDKSTGVSITESQISDLQTYLTTELDGDDANEIQNLSQVLEQNNDAGAQIKNLSDPTDAQDAVTKAYVDMLKAQIERLQLATGIIITDIDGNNYQTVVIGTQEWMAENLKVIHYPNGDPIPLVNSDVDWNALANDDISDAYGYYENNSDNADVFGALYTRSAAIGDNWARDNMDNQGVCPDGWHIPNDAEWTVLITFLESNQGSKLSANAELWKDGALDSNEDFNTAGFLALPAGGRSPETGLSSPFGENCYWWSSTPHLTTHGKKVELNYDFAGIFRHNTNASSGGLSVRCLKNSEIEMEY